MKNIMINAAILHLLKYTQSTEVLSDETMNLEDGMISGYVEKMFKKCLGDVNAQNGQFNDGSFFLSKVTQFEKNEIEFTAFTKEIVNGVKDKLKDVSLQSYGLLFAYFQSEDIPYVGLILLPNEKAYGVSTAMDGDNLLNSIIYADDILPSPEKKIKAFALVNMLSNEVSFLDDMKWNVSDLNSMSDIILDCSAGSSHKEVVDSIETITNDIAEEYDENPTVLLTKVKSFIKQSAEEDTPVQTEDLAIHVFNASEDMQNSFISKSLEADLPKEVELPKKVISREMRTQRIRTDTGINLSFPVEYASDPSKMEFIHHEDGTITIEIHHVGHITNRK